MKRALFAGCLAVMMLLSLSMALLQPVVSVETNSHQNTEQTPQSAVAEAPQDAPAADTEAQKKSFDESYRVRLLRAGTPVTLSLADYLVGVVLAEMPASFEPAALEAQAVAARTFTLKQSQNPKHDNADLCDDGTCCQQYTDPASAKEKLGAHFSQYEEKVREAVQRTDGVAITYQGAYIDAVYFSCSGGVTEDAAAVWGGDVPYLKSVQSPGEENSTRYADEVSVSAISFKDTILRQAPKADLAGEPAGWFGGVTHTSGGGVDTMEIGGAIFSGTELRKLFGLRSTWFTVAVQGDSILFETRGNGHRVGMSQYGAQAMARNGADYEAILLHYYTGVSLTNMQG